MGLSIIELGTLVGSFPCIAMLIASFALTQITLTQHAEAFFQNFCAGLMIGAVAAELFPLLHEGATKQQSIIGISVGIPVALIIIHGIEYLVAIAGEEGEEEKTSDASGSAHKFVSLLGRDTESQTEMTTFSKTPKKRGSWDVEPIMESYNAMVIPEHRTHIRQVKPAFAAKYANQQVLAQH